MCGLSLPAPLTLCVFQQGQPKKKKKTHSACQLATQRTKVKHRALRVHFTEREIVSLIGKLFGSHWSSGTHTLGKKIKQQGLHTAYYTVSTVTDQ